jgi:hypothetical protein
LPAGQYTLRGLLGAPDGVALDVGADGAIANYQPIPGALGRGQVLVFDLITRRR